MIERSPSLWCDVTEFERHADAGRKAAADGDDETALAHLTAAEGCYAGEFLEDSPTEEWTVYERDRLRLLYVDTGNRLAELLFSCGQIEPALDVTHRVLRYDHCDEAAHRRAMRCYARLGRRASVVRQFQQCAGALRRDLQLAPDRETIDLLQAHTDSAAAGHGPRRWVSRAVRTPG
ncbi:MAG: bacterial transcriptional activator domain-containing protein [Acidimicrobiales bacterium]|nr:bacterial transcriptional activator domain-containing protein [Acidimicrobiales bacterium]